jgi:serine/threonine protein kinase
VFEHLLSQSLQDVSDTIGKLHNILKVLLVGSAKQADRAIKKEDALKGATKTYDAFAHGLSSLTPSNTQNVRSLALQILWEHFPRWGDLDGKVGNAEDPGDGLMYDDNRVAHAKSILQDLHKAWLNADGLANFPPPPGLPESGKICLILTGMQQQRLLEDFLDSGCVDGDLPLKRQQLEEVLKGQNIHYAASFDWEQYRAVPRKWEEGSHLEIDEEEPLPLVFETLYRSGSYGIVNRVKDSFSGDLYARKQQIIALEEQITASARKHLKDETDRLKGLRHRHVVQLVKSYQRGQAYGILLKPAATSDLRRLLDRYQADKFFAPEGCTDSVWLSPLFLTAFGCLSKGLAYIHGRNMRHKDVKPANILYERAMRTNGNAARFLWADFGLAYDFSDTGESKTRSTKIYSARYAPPEIVRASAKMSSSRDKRSSVVTKLDEIVENGGEIMIKAEFNPQASEDEVDSHGRSADIFSLGCVYLELLGCLVKQKLPLKENEQKKVMFSNNIPNLCSWAQQMQELDQWMDFRALFALAEKMISPKPNDRLPVNEVVRAIAAAGQTYFCPLCRQEFPAHAFGKSGQKDVQQTGQSTSPSTARSSPRRSSGVWLERVNSAMSQPHRPRIPRLLST